MREIPLLMNGPMVRATLAGHKTNTRREIIRLGGFGKITQFGRSDTPGYDWHFRDSAKRWHDLRHAELLKACPYGLVGDRLCVRETWQYADWTEEGEPHIGYAADGKRVLVEGIPEQWAERVQEIWCELSAPENYDIDNRAADRRWRPNIHMPRWACRILLEITRVRVERLQDISEPDCWAEGIEEVDGSLDDMKIIELAKCMGRCVDDAAPTFAALWESIGGPGSWDENPWVWVVEFRRIA